MAQSRRRRKAIMNDPTTTLAIIEYDLTPRETEILEQLVKGSLYKEIASDLGIGVENVRTHLRNIYAKLHVRTRTEAVVKYLGGP
ncbi:helix-turn-helix transcriptional regulator [Haloferula rosea]|uniref:Helix-turn-helix transcriptional regulator n=2 Tax=Haloferula rosea TaxID=490093 RepID=A0A934RGM6_9BACT|nr:helix-turn-helix transcriptional regulator [Haloferula rosea]